MDPQSAVNWNLSLEMADNNEALAKELLELFAKDLPEFSDKIEKSFTAGDHDTLKDILHKLLGGCCYCGVPHVKKVARQLHDAMNSDYIKTPEALSTKNKLLHELSRVQTHINQLSS